MIQRVGPGLFRTALSPGIPGIPGGICTNDHERSPEWCRQGEVAGAGKGGIPCNLHREKTLRTGEEGNSTASIRESPWKRSFPRPASPAMTWARADRKTECRGKSRVSPAQDLQGFCPGRIMNVNRSGRNQPFPMKPEKNPFFWGDFEPSASRIFS